MNAYKNASFVGIVIFLAGIGMLVYSADTINTEMELDRNGIKTKGKIIDFRKNPPYLSPIVKFKAKSGKTYTFISFLELNPELTRKMGYKIGAEVPVIYHKLEKKSPLRKAMKRYWAEIDSFWERNVMHIYLAGLGVILMLTGFFVFRGLRKKAKLFEQGQLSYQQ